MNTQPEITKLTKKQAAWCKANRVRFVRETGHSHAEARGFPVGGGWFEKGETVCCRTFDGWQVAEKDGQFGSGLSLRDALVILLDVA